MSERPISPIERMIDRATGFDKTPGYKATRPVAPLPITLRCPLCKRTQRADRDVTDPPNTHIVEAPCDKCDHGGLKPETSYFDKDGRQLDLEGNPMPDPSHD